jgi:hypothetical protein
VTILYCGFAYKNLGAIEATAEERQAIRAIIKEYPETGPNSVEIKRVREKLEPTMPEYDIAGARHFHWFCDLMTIAFLWAKEWQRRKTTKQSGVAAER